MKLSAQLFYLYDSSYTHAHTPTWTLRGIPQIFVGIWERDNGSWRAELSTKMQQTQKLTTFLMLHI